MLTLYFSLLAIGGVLASSKGAGRASLGKREERETYPVVTFSSREYRAYTKPTTVRG